MVATERAFAAMGAEKGVRESFYEFFGEEGISFNAHPTRFREYARKNPVPTPAPAREFKLEWWPVYGDVAESGDLGHNTGPTLFTDLTPQNRPSGHITFSPFEKSSPMESGALLYAQAPLFARAHRRGDCATMWMPWVPPRRCRPAGCR